jgi:hypothetical protein
VIDDTALVSSFCSTLIVVSFFSDCFPLVGSTVGCIPCGHVVQYEERSTCVVENNRQYEEYHESYRKVDGGNNIDKLKGRDENGFGLLNTHGLPRLGKNQGSFKGLKEGKNNVEENAQEIARKSNLNRLAPSISFNNRPSKKLSTILRLSFKRKSCDVEETPELGKCLNYFKGLFGLTYFNVSTDTSTCETIR